MIFILIRGYGRFWRSMNFVLIDPRYSCDCCINILRNKLNRGGGNTNIFTRSISGWLLIDLYVHRKTSSTPLPMKLWGINGNRLLMRLSCPFFIARDKFVCGMATSGNKLGQASFRWLQLFFATLTAWFYTSHSRRVSENIVHFKSFLH